MITRMRWLGSISLLIVLVAAWSVGPAGAGEVKLFKEYNFGQSRAVLQNQPGVYDCSQQVSPGALCSDGANFLGLDWEQIFRFLDDKLVQVTLAREFSVDAYAGLFRVLPEKFQLVAMKGKTGFLDVIKESKTKSLNQVKEAITAFEQQGLSNSQLSLVFLEKEGIAKAIKESTNIVGVVETMALGTREIDVMIVGNGPSNVLLVAFMAPQATKRLLGRAGAGKKEDF